MAKIIKAGEGQRNSYSSYERETLLEPQPAVDPELEVEEEALPDPAEILAQARFEAEQKVKEAYAEGYRRGEEKGLADFKAKVDKASDVLLEAAAAMQDTQMSFLATVVPQIAQLVQNVAARILQRESRTDPELIQSTVRSALQAMLDRQRVTVRVNPADLEVLRENKADLLSAFEGLEQFRVEASDDVTRGGCVMESDTMVINATMEAQLKHIFDTLLE